MSGRYRRGLARLSRCLQECHSTSLRRRLAGRCKGRRCGCGLARRTCRRTQFDGHGLSRRQAAVRRAVYLARLVCRLLQGRIRRRRVAYNQIHDRCAEYPRTRCQPSEPHGLPCGYARIHLAGGDYRRGNYVLLFPIGILHPSGVAHEQESGRLSDLQGAVRCDDDMSRLP